MDSQVVRRWLAEEDCAPEVIAVFVQHRTEVEEQCIAVLQAPRTRFVGEGPHLVRPHLPHVRRERGPERAVRQHEAIDFLAHVEFCLA